MTSERRPDSLAEQAAAWVPPWERPAEAQPPLTAAETTDPAESPEPGDSRDNLESPEPGDSAETAELTDAVESAAAVAVAGADEADEPAEPVLAEEPARAAGGGERGPVPEEVAGVPDYAGTGADGASAAVPEPGGAGRRATALALIDDDELRGALEAILLVVDEPVTEIVLAQVLEQPTERIAALLDRLAAGYTTAGHGFELRRAAGGWRLYTRPEYAAYVERFVLDGQSVRLTQAALETLAVVAYKQPVTRSRISAIRGVNCDGVIRTLVTRGLVEECGTEPESGAFLYRTTTLFLEKLGLDTVNQLPPLAPFLPDDVEEIADAPR
ncbi:SMC-Scp complex subunit ScpB [Micromonospora sp. WMMD1102]|uniref:SMC-Scp complex subunit ScpB n=1 Tax=Micromonospora sp. WMMD1102 TaxID=3016105 RepID=UPI002414EE75|nr:SMC-Scp complex subunit ScpB [Micromonospora sp. WMMD1102]MDG4788106.1 SMC-Scp complex subunit ScpB [Micromonospora sp. WMMD1102]